ncbi:Uncharacterised protein [Vibrio cholerae]|nr:Uncharacterised protein [Vibrio cholerae]
MFGIHTVSTGVLADYEQLFYARIFQAFRFTNNFTHWAAYQIPTH